MNALLQEFNSYPIVILAFPCNQFGKQEPGANDEIINGLKYVRPGHGYIPSEKIHFFAKTEVNGNNENVLFQKLKGSCPPTRSTIGKKDSMFWSPIKANDLTWNFVKFLLDKNGIPRFRFGSSVTSIQMKHWINLLLAEDS